jgi:type I restriction enzyme S subunit
MKGRIGWQGLTQAEFTDEGPYLITGMNFKNGKMNWDECYHISEERFAEAPEIHVQEGDVLITKDGTIGKLLYMDYLPGPTSLNSHLLILRPRNNEFASKYLYYLLHSDAFLRYVDNVKTGTTFYGISQASMGDFRMLIFDKEEQQAIAEFLDRKTAQIDDLIAKKQRQIDLLHEQSTALINQAVTGKLDLTGFQKPVRSGRPMKDSGVEWLGEIPSHWEVYSMKYLTHLKSGESITSNEIKEEGPYTVYGGNGIRGYYDKYTHDGEFVLIGRQGALCGNINYAQGKFWASEHAVVATPKKEYKVIWFGELLRTMNLNQYSMSAAQPGLSVERISNLKISVPSRDEQNKIEAFIKENATRIENLVTLTQEQIELYKEYRTALISAAVTGKIDVREEGAVHE